MSLSTRLSISFRKFVFLASQPRARARARGARGVLSRLNQNERNYRWGVLVAKDLHICYTHTLMYAKADFTPLSHTLQNSLLEPDSAAEQ